MARRVGEVEISRVRHLRDECACAEPAAQTLKLNVAKKIFLRYDELHE